MRINPKTDNILRRMNIYLSQFLKNEDALARC